VRPAPALVASGHHPGHLRAPGVQRPTRQSQPLVLLFGRFASSCRGLELALERFGSFAPALGLALELHGAIGEQHLDPLEDLLGEGAGERLARTRHAVDLNLFALLDAGVIVLTGVVDVRRGGGPQPCGPSCRLHEVRRSSMVEPLARFRDVPAFRTS
jgi:hypothetical protein